MVRDYLKGAIKRLGGRDDSEIIITQAKRLDIVISSVALHW